MSMSNLEGFVGRNESPLTGPAHHSGQAEPIIVQLAAKIWHCA